MATTATTQHSCTSTYFKRFTATDLTKKEEAVTCTTTVMSTSGVQIELKCWLYWHQVSIGIDAILAWWDEFFTSVSFTPVCKAVVMAKRNQPVRQCRLLPGSCGNSIRTNCIAFEHIDSIVYIILYIHTLTYEWHILFIQLFLFHSFICLFKRNVGLFVWRHRTPLVPQTPDSLLLCPVWRPPPRQLRWHTVKSIEFTKLTTSKFPAQVNQIQTLFFVLWYSDRTCKNLLTGWHLLFVLNLSEKINKSFSISL